MTIQFVVKAPHFAAANGWGYVAGQYALAFIEPFGTLWFIYLLPIFFVVTKAVRNAPPLLIWLVAAALQIAQIDTGWTAIDEFAGRFVYFYTGYLMAARIFALAAAVQARQRDGRACAVVMGGAQRRRGVHRSRRIAGGVARPRPRRRRRGGVGVGPDGEGQVFDPVRYCGEHSIVIYLTFFLPMAATRTLLVKTGIIPDVGTVSLLVTAAGVIGALAIWWTVRNTRANVLFERPDHFRIAPRSRAAMQPAE